MTLAIASSLPQPLQSLSGDSLPQVDEREDNELDPITSTTDGGFAVHRIDTDKVRREHHFEKSPLIEVIRAIMKTSKKTLQLPSAHPTLAAFGWRAIPCSPAIPDGTDSSSDEQQQLPLPSARSKPQKAPEKSTDYEEKTALRKVGEFSAVVYTKKTSSTSHRHLEIGELIGEKIQTSTQTSCIVFLYLEEAAGRIEQLFALTTGHGWQQIQNYCDYQYPFSIMQHFGDPAQILRYKHRPLDERVSLILHVWRLATSVNPLLHIDSKFTGFSCGLLRDTTLYELPCIQALLGKKAIPTKVKLDVGLRALSFSTKKLTLNDYGLILSQFPPHPAAAAGWEFLHHTVINDPAQLAQLEADIDAKPINDGSIDFYLSLPEGIEDYLAMDGEATPFVHSSFPALLSEPDLKVKNLKDMQIIKESGEITQLSDYVEGNYYCSTEPYKGTYYRLREGDGVVWYRVQTKQQEIFREASQKIVAAGIGPREVGFLPLPWPKGMLEGAYNQLYFERENYLFGDKVYYQGKESIELFDLIYVDPDTSEIFIYQLKSGNMNRDTRVAYSQITNSARIILRCIRDPGSNELRRWYTEYTKKIQPRVPQYTQEEFLALFSKQEKITFVFATTDTKFEELNGEEYTIAMMTLPKLQSEVEELGFKFRTLSIPHKAATAASLSSAPASNKRKKPPENDLAPSKAARKPDPKPTGKQQTLKELFKQS
jgi:hypothetical protein